MNIPAFLSTLNTVSTLKHKRLLLKQHNLKSTFKTGADCDSFIQRLQWCYTLPWRQEQKKCLDTFCERDWDELIIQAIFGGGKTTMMMAMITHLILHKITLSSNIQVCAFNVCIKNEIRKKLRPISSKIKINTFDSLIYRLCAELGYENLKALDFSGKRRFVLHNLSKIEPDTSVEYLFVDEAQDLEKTAYHVFEKRFPCAKKVFVGDVFQSIQKEPRESMLWYFLRRDDTTRFRRFTMTDTPRVPLPILSEIQTALLTFYPEFSDTINKWTSSSTVHTNASIEWKSFDSYSVVYERMKSFIKEKGASNVMILTFSSAITVRGVLGDVSRVRQYLIEQNIPVNLHHKQMKDDCVFLSTANSSKGLERDYIFAFLTFPLELAFANFSDDLVVNLTTVALSRAKKSVVFYVPTSKDRFSNVLNLYHECPQPTVDGMTKKNMLKKKPNSDTVYEDFRTQKRRMLEKEQSITETLRLSILSFQTQTLLKSYAKKYKTVPLEQSEFKNTSMSEEDSTFSGVVFETLTLGLWKKTWPKNSATEGTFEHHDVFQSFQRKIQNMRRAYMTFQKRYPSFHQLSLQKQVEGAVLYSKLHLACFQKIFWRHNPSLVQKIVHHWQRIRHTIQQYCPPDAELEHLKVQQNVAMPFLTGIADAIVMPPSTSKHLLEVFEIKASKSPDWLDRAFLQSLLYGLCLSRGLFRIHLVNVYHKEIQSYIVQFKEDIGKVREAVMTDIRQWNLHCFLAKNVTHHDTIKKTLNIHGAFFLDGNHESKIWNLYEIVSPTKTYCHVIDDADIDTKLVRYVQDFQIQKIIVSRRLSEKIVSQRFASIASVFRFLRYPQKCFTEHGSWQYFLQSIGWYDYVHEDHHKTFLDWEIPQCTFMVQWATLCIQYNMVC